MTKSGRTLAAGAPFEYCYEGIRQGTVLRGDFKGRHGHAKLPAGPTANSAVGLGDSSNSMIS